MSIRLAAKELTFRYDASVPLIERWSAEFSAGEVVAVTGPSGRGKSTLLYLLGLMLQPASGKVLIDGEPSQQHRDAARAQVRASRFGFVFQDAALDQSRTVLDNILESTLYRRADRRSATNEARTLMERFGVALRAEAKPGQVSGGQAQRIALCRALLSNPDIILADEPTGNLDPASSAIVIDAFHERAALGATVVVVTHDPSVVLRCDRKTEL